MNKKTIISVLILTIVSILYFSFVAGINNKKIINTVAFLSPPQINPKDFINCIFNEDYQPDEPNLWILHNLDRYKDSLHFNTIHYYGSSSERYGIFDDTLTDAQRLNVIEMMDSIEDKELKGWHHRLNISNYCYGQRLEYEAEGGNYGFSYQTKTDTIIQDSGRTVIHGRVSSNNTPRYLSRDIYENLQHGDLFDFNQLDAGTWFIKPLMRIDSSVVDNNPDANIVRIDVINFTGDTIKSSVIKALDFSVNRDGNYSGKYINAYSTSLSLLQVSGNPDNSASLNYGVKNVSWQNWKDECKIDFRIWWYGEADVMFDKMIVDDERADRLFNPLTNQIKADVFIKQEVNYFSTHSSNPVFFVDEVLFSSIPCIDYVDSIMKTQNSNVKLHIAVTNYLNTRAFKDNTLAHKALMEKLNITSFNCDAHEIIRVKLPPQFNNSDSRFPDEWKSANVNEYTESLQNKAFGHKDAITIDENEDIGFTKPPSWGSLIYQVALARNQRDQYNAEAKFIMQPQIHGWLHKRSTDNQFLYGLREPTNEEIQAEAMISIAHGAEGICWFFYPSIKFPITPLSILRGHSQNLDIANPRDTFFGYGLTKVYQEDNSLSPRYVNLYGQDKWNYVKRMNIKIEHWKPTLDKISWLGGYSVHSENAGHEFISDIKSIKRNPLLGFTDDPPCTYCDGTNERYWEMGFFEPDSIPNDKSKYFLMVNRRCIPDTPNYGQGDLRQLKIKFNSTQLASFRNWKITDINTNLLIRTFDKDSNIYVNMGEFNPGEGKLYKLAPVMQEGGTLVADEEVSNIQFVCNGIVLNNGKNITIGSGTEIFFREGAGINMTGGNFICDGSPGNGNILLQGIYREVWNGINLINTGSLTKIEKTTFENTKSPVVIDNSQFGSQYAQKIIRRNIFYITHDSGIALRIRNQFAMLIDSNTFDVSNFNITSGIYFSNYSDPGPAGGTTDDNCFVNITNNTF